MPRVRPASAGCGRGDDFSAALKSAGATISPLEGIAGRIFLVSLHFGFSSHVTLRRLAAVCNFSLISFEANYPYTGGLHMSLSSRPRPALSSPNSRQMTGHPTSSTRRSWLSLRRLVAGAKRSSWTADISGPKPGRNSSSYDYPTSRAAPSGLRSGESEQMTQQSRFDDDGTDHHLSSSAAIETLMRASRVMAVRGFVLSIYALSLATQDHHSTLSHVVSGSAAPRLARDLEEANSDDLAGNER